MEESDVLTAVRELEREGHHVRTVLLLPHTPPNA